jgi:hypothetical protein
MLSRHFSSSHGKLLSDIKNANVYNKMLVLSPVIGITTYINLLVTLLHQLRKNGFTINPLKCEWAVKETDWLDYWLTTKGLKPWKKKISTILHMDHSCNATELCMFIGCINIYRDIWLSRAHILKPLTGQSSLKKKAPI